MKNHEYTARNHELFAELKKYPKDSKEYREIANKIVKTNEGLVKSIAKKHFSTLIGPTLNCDDLMSAGYLGLFRAIQLYELERDVVFSTYATPTIRGYMLIHLREERKRYTVSLEDDADGDKRKLKDVLASPVNMEEDFVDRDETDRQLAWVRKNLDKLPPFQKKVLIAKYLSGGASLDDNALAKGLECSRQNVLDTDKAAVFNLKEMYYGSHAYGIELTQEEKIAARGVLKKLILTKLAPQQKKTMLCRFYSESLKTYKQVAQEVNLTERAVNSNVTKATRKLCVIYNGIQNQKYLTSDAIRDILRFSSEANQKSR